ncbi:MAG TPA: EMC3/TMCO1 family protein [Candidatus Bilamarchaeum sp.]|nr:EMC3/TMCO1 family protein [Candidatus Bilamarchaeum sp.]
MVFEIFTALVAFLAVAYAGITKFVQNKLIDRSEMEGLQKESKRLSEEFDKAKKANDKKKMDRIMKEQMEFFPKMNKAMMGQFKPMAVILIVFFAFTWVVGQLDPAVKDDIAINMTDDGSGCDALAGDGIFTACHTLESENEGRWVVSAKAYRGGSELGANSTAFAYVAGSPEGYLENPHGEQILLSTDKQVYSKGDEARIYANATADRIEARLDSGTAFSVELPFTIPLINVKTIHQPYWWFISISLVTNLTLTFVMGRLGKKGAQK